MRWRRIACLGCSIVLVVGIFLAYVFFDTLLDLFKIEFTESNLQPVTDSTEIFTDSSSGEINDLSYIQTLAVGYTDDGDPDYDGISIDIIFFDSKSEIITFSDIPLIVNIELYAYQNPLEIFEISQGDLVYEGSISVDHSMRLGEMASNYIRIPFEEINIDENQYQSIGTIRVIVLTSMQGEFETKEDFVPLYPDDIGQ